MAGRRYDHPNAIVRRLYGARGAATASGTNAALYLPQKAKLIAVHGRASVAGTNVANHVYTIRNHTSSLGTIAMGTTAINGTVVTTLNVELAAGATINCLKGSDATGVTDFTYEYEVQPDAVLTND